MESLNDRGDIVKKRFVMLAIGCFFVALSACGTKEKIKKGIAQGIYDSTNQTQALRANDPTTSVGKEIPTYDQYEKERQEMKNDSTK